MTDSNDSITGQAGDVSAELVTPDEHAAAIPELAPAENVTALDAADEVAARSADMDKPSTEHRKVFILGPGRYDSSTDYDHEPNKAATRQYAIDGGLWPVGDVRFISNKLHPDGKSRVLSYGVQVEPAHNIVEGARHPEVVGEAVLDRDGDGNVTGLDDAVKPANAERITEPEA